MSNPYLEQSYVFFNSDLTVDFIKVEEESLNLVPTSEALENDSNSIYKLDGSTTLYNTFNKTADAEYLDPENYNTSAKYTFYRKTPDEEYYEFICELPEGEHTLKDYNLINDNYYHYLITIETKTQQGSLITFFEKGTEESEDYYIHTDWWKWSLCDIVPTEEENIYNKTGTVWLFAYNMEAGNYTQNTSVTNWDTLGKYGKYSIGQKNYDSSSFSCLLGDMDEFYDYTSYKSTAMGCNSDTGGRKLKRGYRYSEKEKILTKEQYDAKMEEYSENPIAFQNWLKEQLEANKYSREIEKTNSWKKFITNGNLKLLKDYKGGSWVIQVMPNSQRMVDLKSNYQQTTVSFEWQEALDVSNIVILGSVNDDGN